MRLRAVFLLLIFLIAGCFGNHAETKKENVKTADFYTRHQKKNGLTIGIKPLVSAEKSKLLFDDIDIFSKGVKAIFVVISNKSKKTYFLDTLQVYLRNKKGKKQFPISASKLVDKLSGTSAKKEKNSPFSFITSNALTYKLGKRARVEKDMEKEVLQSMKINSGHQVEGFLFFSMNGDMKSLSIPMFDVVEKKLIDFEISVQ